MPPPPIIRCMPAGIGPLARAIIMPLGPIMPSMPEPLAIIPGGMPASIPRICICCCCMRIRIMAICCGVMPGRIPAICCPIILMLGDMDGFCMFIMLGLLRIISILCCSVMGPPELEPGGICAPAILVGLPSR